MISLSVINMASVDLSVSLCVCSGGALWLYYTKAMLVSAEFRNNTSGYFGGALKVENGNLTCA